MTDSINGKWNSNIDVAFFCGCYIVQTPDMNMDFIFCGRHKISIDKSKK